MFISTNFSHRQQIILNCFPKQTSASGWLRTSSKSYITGVSAALDPVSRVGNFESHPLGSTYALWHKGWGYRKEYLTDSQGHILPVSFLPGHTESCINCFGPLILLIFRFLTYPRISIWLTSLHPRNSWCVDVLMLFSNKKRLHKSKHTYLHHQGYRLSVSMPNFETTDSRKGRRNKRKCLQPQKVAFKSRFPVHLFWLVNKLEVS